MTIYTVKTLNDYGPGSLRDGIKYANCNKNITINFAVNGEINLTCSLPPITSPTNIIGNLSDSGIPLNIINGRSRFKIFKIYETCNCSIQNLCIINSSYSGIFINKSSCVEIYKCRIGIDTYECPQPNVYGIVICKSFNITVGSNPDLVQQYFSNVVSGNKKVGINIIESKHNNIKNNIIGLSSDFSKKVPNNCGINILYSNKNTIGGKEFIDNDKNINNPTGDKGTIPPVFVRPLEGNIISGNNSDGISLRFSNNNIMAGNFIGTDNTGILNFGNSGNGIFLNKSNFNFITGCGVDSNPFIYYNVIGWNSCNGIHVYNSNFTTIQGNFLGIASNNSDAAPNSTGLKVSESSTETAVGGIIPLGNVISGNNSYGIHITDNSDGFFTVNTFCGLKAFAGALPNNLDGILIDKNAKNIKINTNVISGNNGNGISIAGKSNNILIGNNIVGMNTSGNSPLPNKLNGIKISEYASNIFDGAEIPSVINQNTISANQGYGVLIEGHVFRVVMQFSNIGQSINFNDTYSNGKGGILLKDCVNGCSFGNSVKFLYIYDEFNFAMGLCNSTFNNVVTYCFINTNNLNAQLPHNKNIINLSSKNFVFGNALPIN